MRVTKTLGVIGMTPQDVRSLLGAVYYLAGTDAE